jgi:hypothetical protein
MAVMSNSPGKHYSKHLFTSSLMLRENKKECLFYSSFFRVKLVFAGKANQKKVLENFLRPYYTSPSYKFERLSLASFSNLV